MIEIHSISLFSFRNSISAIFIFSACDQKRKIVVRRTHVLVTMLPFLFFWNSLIDINHIYFALISNILIKVPELSFICRHRMLIVSNCLKIIIAWYLSARNPTANSHNVKVWNEACTQFHFPPQSSRSLEQFIDFEKCLSGHPTSPKIPIPDYCACPKKQPFSRVIRKR